MDLLLNISFFVTYLLLFQQKNKINATVIVPIYLKTAAQPFDKL